MGSNPYLEPVPGTLIDAPVAASAPAGSQISEVRVGEHTGKTRVVFDASEEVAFSYNVANENKTLVLDFPGSGWSAPGQMTIADSPLVSSWQAAPRPQGGTRVTVQLARPARVLWAQALPAAPGAEPRVVVDLAAL